MEARTKHFWRTLPPTSFLAVNRKDWKGLLERLNGGVPVPQERQLSYCVLVLHCAIVLRSFFGGLASQGPIRHPAERRGAAAAVLLRRDPCMVLIA